MVAIASVICFALAVLTSESVWIKNIIKQQCTDSYIENIFLTYEHKTDYASEVLVESMFVWIVLVIWNVAYFIMRTQVGDLSSKIVEV